LELKDAGFWFTSRRRKALPSVAAAPPSPMPLSSAMLSPPSAPLLPHVYLWPTARELPYLSSTQQWHRWMPWIRCRTWTTPPFMTPQSTWPSRCSLLVAASSPSNLRYFDSPKKLEWLINWEEGSKRLQ
jgi:hypothetical protein